MSAFDEVMAAPDGALIAWQGMDGLRECAAIDKPMELYGIGVTDEDVRGFGRAITCYPGDLPQILVDLGAIVVSGEAPAMPEPPPPAEPEAPAADTPVEPVADGNAQ